MRRLFGFLTLLIIYVKMIRCVKVVWRRLVSLGRGIVMAVDKSKYRAIDPHMLLNGMYSDTDLFYLVSGNPVLLTANEVIDINVIDRLHQIANRGAEIYVENESYDKLMQQYEIISKKNKETEKKYSSAKQEMKSFLGETKETETINVDEVLRLMTLAEDSLNVMNPSFLLQWASYMDDMDELLQTHSVDVAILNGMMGKWLGLDDQDVWDLLIIGLLHDIGKLKIPDEILNKPGKLTPEEFEVIKKHPVYSYEMMVKSGIDNEVLLAGVRGHHERLSGTGYPDGLKVGEISLFSRITSISDIYDAMVSKRVYKAASTPLVVLDYFYRDQFSDLDIRLVEVFLDHMVEELNGKYVILSNGHMGRIAYIEKSHVANPIIETPEGAVATTSDGVHVVTVCGDIISNG